MILRANCKINLGLDILRRRADGFHDLETVMFPVAGLYDEVEVVRTGASGSVCGATGAPGAAFRAEGLAVDCAPEENICLKAFRLMQRHYGVDGVSIRLDKRVPFGAGLGGGSADGTAVLIAVNELFALGLSESELIARAAELGSDTAFFVRNTPQLCKGRGEVMEPFALDLSGMTLVIIKPDEGVSTREAYAGVQPRIPETPLAERLRRPVAEWQGLVTNDFEEHILAAHPAILAAKECLLAQGAVYASMSGSGSAVFGLFDGGRNPKNKSLENLSPFVFEL
ncbi:4-(cytidine 5'-diphospho)-2-C-methyl-D-erythritol kinase [Alistipes sp. D31t1_170403_E11]|uniref:4-(cytidine 5'-diphospho)-2-C-methyl-D-erythritol kinase n=1 Tax=Alistipes sp. D31t1_170403_E11 TaxID=2787128 RepID=UPI001897B5E9|nr:4-(cytidine 5'-diphospho)-2-C-methyl-D-erythritol kinase [Alistipes sp. D31t1_170403_E11]